MSAEAQPFLHGAVIVAVRERSMNDQPNKPGGAFDDEGEPRPAADQQAVKNQSVVKPSDYPEPAGSELRSAKSE